MCIIRHTYVYVNICICIYIKYTPSLPCLLDSAELKKIRFHHLLLRLEPIKQDFLSETSTNKQ